jgi:hypothetical protein
MTNGLIEKIGSLDERVKKIIVTDSDIRELKSPSDRIIAGVQDIEEINKRINQMLQCYYSYERRETKDFSYKKDNTIGLHKAKFWIEIWGIKALDTRFVADILTKRIFDAGGGGFGDNYYDVNRILVEDTQKHFVYDKMQIGEPIAVLEDGNLTVLGDYKRNVPGNWKWTVINLKKDGIETSKKHYETRDGKVFINGEEPGTFVEVNNKRVKK